MGKLPPTMLNPAPEVASELIVTGVVPVDVSVTVCICAELMATFPKLRLLALTNRNPSFDPCPCTFEIDPTPEPQPMIAIAKKAIATA